MSKKPVIRKYGRTLATGKFKFISTSLTLTVMFERFMLYKETEGLVKVTIRDYYIHFNYLKEYLGEETNQEDLTLDLFLCYIGYMLHEK